MNELKQLPWKLFAIIITLWFLVGILPYTLWRDLHAASDFANTFGFVNALFAALAFGGVIWAIRLQTRELELQRIEVESTRDELRRSADAQQLSQEMHFLAALLAARNSVAQGFAAAAQRETGTLRPSHLAHRQQLMELQSLLGIVDQHKCNPFALPSLQAMIAGQVGVLLGYYQPALQSALTHQATNHVRSLVTDLANALRDYDQMAMASEASGGTIGQALRTAIRSADAVHQTCEFEELSAACLRFFNGLARAAESSCHLKVSAANDRGSATDSKAQDSTNASGEACSLPR